MIRKIGITACSDPRSRESVNEIDKLIYMMEQMGYETVLSDYIYDRGDGFAGSGKERAHALMQQFEDPDLKMIFDISGGDMANEILPYLDFDLIGKSHKLFAGYSDLTTILNAIYAKTGERSCLYQIRNIIYDQGERQAMEVKNYLEGKDNELFELPCHFLQGEHMEGILVGGNIRCFLKLAGTDCMPDLTGKILLLEAMGGGVSQMTTFLSQLKMMGAFEKIGGILLGTFSKMEREKIRPSMEALVLSYAGKKMPVAKTAYIGHGSDSKAAMIGEYYRFGEK